MSGITPSPAPDMVFVWCLCKSHTDFLIKWGPITSTMMFSMRAKGIFRGCPLLQIVSRISLKSTIHPLVTATDFSKCIHLRNPATVLDCFDFKTHNLGLETALHFELWIYKAMGRSEHASPSPTLCWQGQVSWTEQPKGSVSSQERDWVRVL